MYTSKLASFPGSSAHLFLHILKKLDRRAWERVRGYIKTTIVEIIIFKPQSASISSSSLSELKHKVVLIERYYMPSCTLTCVHYLHHRSNLDLSKHVLDHIILQLIELVNLHKKCSTVMEWPLDFELNY